MRTTERRSTSLLRRLGPALITGASDANSSGIAVPIMVLMTGLASSLSVMGAPVNGPRVRALGWLATTSTCGVVASLAWT